jgi:ATP-dependent Clp protease ATP-binding subunit ClpB
MTSNLGSAAITAAPKDVDGGLDQAAIRDAVMVALRSHFRPEFLNRLDEVVIFEPLRREDMEAIVDIQMRRLHGRLADQQISLTLTDDARALLARKGYDPEYGARPLKRAIQTLVENPLAEEILSGRFGEGSAVVGTADGDALDFTMPN